MMLQYAKVKTCNDFLAFIAFIAGAGAATEGEAAAAEAGDAAGFFITNFGIDARNKAPSSNPYGLEQK